MADSLDPANAEVPSLSARDESFGGIFDGFEAYRTPTVEDYQRLLTEGLVAVDTNVLLNLYRYNDDTRNDLLSVLRRLGDRLWVPQQVIEEFWRNREAVLKDPRDTAKTIQELAEQRDRSLRIFHTWARRVGLSEDRNVELTEVLSTAFVAVADGVTELADDEALEFARNTNKDPVVVELDTILQGRVGRPLSPAEHEKALEEAKRRVEMKLPPGYKDSAKGSEGAAGDYLVWVQLLREAERRCVDVLLVTGDVKEDWWRRERGELRGPRRELVDELYAAAGVRFFMLRPDGLMLQARSALQIDVRDESVDDVERVDRSLAETENGGWTVESLFELLFRLNSENCHPQIRVIQAAGKGDGFVDRETVYSLGRYEESRSLRGFTRPINRITNELRERGLVAESADDVLSAVYDDTIGNPGWASGFRVAPSVLPLLRRLVNEKLTYNVIDAKPFVSEDHRQGTVGRDGKCSLHGCGEPAVATMTCIDSGGNRVVLAVCERGVREYDLRSRFGV